MESISRFIERGLTIPEAASISGHKAQSMLLRYAHPDLSYIKNRYIFGELSTPGLMDKVFSKKGLKIRCNCCYFILAFN